MKKIIITFKNGTFQDYICDAVDTDNGLLLILTNNDVVAGVNISEVSFFVFEEVEK